MSPESLICNYWLVAFVLVISTTSKSHGESWKRRISREDNLFGDHEQNDFFGGAFDEMEQRHKAGDQLDEGFEIWEQKCLKVGGQKALDDWLLGQESLVYCVMENFEVTTIQNEVEAKRQDGDLDEFFKKYCGEPVRKTRPCVENFLEVSSQCLKLKDRAGLNTTMTMVDAAINFVCHNSGDRIAMFMAEDGVKCVTERRDNILRCLNNSAPELFKTFSEVQTGNGRRRSVDPVFAYNEENCRRGYEFRECVETELLKCKDPTPSNVINAMFIAMWKTTPCNKIPISASSAVGVTLTSLLLNTVVWPSFLLLLFRHP